MFLIILSFCCCTYWGSSVQDRDIESIQSLYLFELLSYRSCSVLPPTRVGGRSDMADTVKVGVFRPLNLPDFVLASPSKLVQL